MVHARRLVLPALAAGAALAYALHRCDLHRLADNVRRYSAPDAGLYDALTARPLDGFFGRVAGEVAWSVPGAGVLEVGSGPGRLAVKIAEHDPEARVTGVDIAPEMVERADSLAARTGVANRVGFLVGDVASLPFPDASFDVVVSTFSVHHWPVPSRGLAEIHRVLRPGGVARIYDLAGWARRLEHGGAAAAELAAGGPFDEGGVRGQSVVARFGPIPLVYLAELERGEAGATDEDPG